jgi:enoyl-CoA hydratase
MSYQNILVETHDKVGLIRLNRPKALNALSDDLAGELGTALLAFDAQDEIGCIIVTGSEKAFAAGADISVMAGFDYMDVFNGEFIATGRPCAASASRSLRRWRVTRWAAAVSWR